MFKPQILGRIYLPRTEGAPVGEFRFIVDPQATDVEIGVPVAADTAEGVLVSTVIDMRTYGEDREPLGSFLARAGGSCESTRR